MPGLCWIFPQGIGTVITVLVVLALVGNTPSEYFMHFSISWIHEYCPPVLPWWQWKLYIFMRRSQEKQSMEHAVLQCGEFSYHSRLNVNGRELKMGRDEAMFAAVLPTMWAILTLHFKSQTSTAPSSACLIIQQLKQTLKTNKTEMLHGKNCRHYTQTAKHMITMATHRLSLQQAIFSSPPNDSIHGRYVNCCHSWPRFTKNCQTNIICIDLKWIFCVK